MRNRQLVAATIVLALAVTGLGSATPVPAQTPGPTFGVEPSTDLVDGQSVRYDGSGFSAGAGFAILQCIPGATTLTEVLAKCEVRQSVTADATGSFSGFVSVERILQPMTGAQPVDCAAAAGACAVSVFDMSSTVIDALVAFADPSIPRPAISVSPASDLEEGDVVTVTGSGFPAGAAVTVAQCVANRPATADWCDDRPPVIASADAAGAFVLEVTIHRGITTPSGLVTDCSGDASTPCAITAFTSDGASGATMPIALTFRRVLATTSTPLTVSSQGTVDVTGDLFCLPASSRAVEVSGILTQSVEDRVITAEFNVTASCPAVSAAWSTQVGGSRTQRFKVGLATVTAWAVEDNDPLPDDAERRTIGVELVRQDP